MSNDQVNHPSHYGGDTPYEAIKVMEAWHGPEAVMWFCILSAEKYFSRAGKKSGEAMEKDLKKAAWYTEHAAKMKARIPPPKQETGPYGAAPCLCCKQPTTFRDRRKRPCCNDCVDGAFRMYEAELERRARLRMGKDIEGDRLVAELKAKGLMNDGEDDIDMRTLARRVAWYGARVDTKFIRKAPLPPKKRRGGKR